MPHDRELDALIDRALAAYAEPQPGLEERVLRGLSPHRSASMRASRRQWFAWALVPLAVACLMVVVFFSMRSFRTPTSPAPVRNHAYHAAPQRPTLPLPLTPTPESRPHASVPHATHRVIPSAHPLPKRDVFPSPQTLAPEEQALVHLVKQAPENQIHSLLEDQQRDATPLQISSIRIAPIEWPEAKN